MRNFAGISEAEIELGRMNIFIGPQASGKSVCAKLFFFFKETPRRVVLGVMEERTKPQLRSSDRDLFLNYFPATSWNKGSFKITYSCGDFSVTVSRKGRDSSTVEITYSDYYDRILQAARQALRKAQEPHDPEEYFPDVRSSITATLNAKISQEIGSALANNNYFIPAGRSFFSTIQSNVFSFIASNLRIDPFLAEFGRLYERYRGIYVIRAAQRKTDKRKLTERVERLLCGTYMRVKGDDFIRMSDDRQIPLSSSSSGQQEVLPLAITLASIAGTARGAARSTLIVEEPEAHLYPSAQREIVHLFAAATDLSLKVPTTQFLITTHSPYILSALNNLMYGASIVRNHPDRRRAVIGLLGDEVLIDPDLVCAYALGDGKVKSIIDRETGLVDAAMLDRVSGEIAREFERLMTIEPIG